MWYYKARIYSPTLGRFMQTDPIGYEDQVNLYAYVGNDPVNSVDPDGEAGVAGAAVGAALDILIQATEIALDDDKDITDFSVGSVFISAAAGAIGVGVVSKLEKAGTIAGRVAGIAADAAISAGSRAAKGEKVTASGVAADVLGGKLGGVAGKLFGKTSGAARSHGQRVHKIEGRARNSRLSAKQKERARAQAERARQNQRAAVQRAGSVGSGVGGAVAQQAEACLRIGGCEK